MIETRLRSIPFYTHDDEDLSNAIRRNGDFWEGDILDYIRDTFPVQKVVLDIGANIGNHTVYFATYLQEYTKIIAFEPLLRNYEILKKNTERFDRSKVFLYQQGLSDSPAWMSIHANVGNLGASEMTLNPEYTDERVFTNTVDEMSQWFHPVTLMKIDVEWWEPQVLRGAQETIQRDHPLILIEDSEKKYGSLLPDYELLMAWDHHRTYLYKWRE